MTSFTPKHHPWKPVTGYETVDAYKILSTPITNQRMLPSYVPDGMLTEPQKFPNFVIGYNRNPIHVARAALNTRYTAEKWFDSHKSLMDEVTYCLKDAQESRENLENLIRERKAEIKKSNNTHIDSIVNFWNSNVQELSTKLDCLITETNKMQDCKRKLQSTIQSSEAVLQIAQECLYLREARHKRDLVNDEVEQLLMNEVEVYRENEKVVAKYLEQCENHMLQGRKLQSELENFIRSIQWPIFIARSEKEIESLSKSESKKEQVRCYLKNADAITNILIQLHKQININVDEVAREILKVWTNTNRALKVRISQTQEAKDDIECSISKIKNEIFNVEKNLKYLKSNKDMVDNRAVQQGKDQLASLLRTKKNLESELSSKLDSLFIDHHKCMTLRNSYPILITISH